VTRVIYVCQLSRSRFSGQASLQGFTESEYPALVAAASTEIALEALHAEASEAPPTLGL
jgi:hypothetical protein